uniref:ShKT domain-containing protein n=1 Tax=Panagrolaimus sp. PS1159 TaxID=55785 RepID=A0AC35FDI3_9BILA
MNTAAVFILFSAIAICVTYGQLGVCIGGLCPSGYVCNTGNYCYLATTCFDIATNCAANVGLCTNSLYLSTMTSKCRRTCNLCGGTSLPSTSTCCSDLLNSSGINECSSLARLCNNTAYYTLMTQQCPRTCGRCVCG